MTMGEMGCLIWDWVLWWGAAHLQNVGLRVLAGLSLLILSSFLPMHSERPTQSSLYQDTPKTYS